MHFLCLHGTGTTSKILDIQTAAFRYELGDGHTYDFVEGACTQPLEPELQDLAPNEPNGLSYFDLSPNATPSFQCIDDLETHLENEGPFDGVLAFSQGIVVASTLILRHLSQNKPSPFKVALFFSPRYGPFDETEFHVNNKIAEIDFDESRDLMKVPTALIWGRRDADAEKAKDLIKIVPEGKLACYVHEGGHNVPGVGNQGDLLGSVNAARRAIDFAS